MAIRDLDHINIRTDRLEETRAFFVDILGLTEGWRPRVSMAGYWLYAGERACVHLSVAEGPPAAPRAALDHFAFRIDDWDGMVAKLEAHGIEHRTLQVPDAPNRQIVCRDPNGVSVELNWPGSDA